MVKLRDCPCRRITPIAPGWPNMPWFWDLVAMSSQIPLCLSNLLTQTTQESTLNLHAWLREPRHSMSRASLRQWMHELRLLNFDDNLTHHLDSLNKGRTCRGILTWNICLVLHQLKKASFEPLKEISLKHLIYKTFFP